MSKVNFQNGKNYPHNSCLEQLSQVLQNHIACKKKPAEAGFSEPFQSD